MAYTYNPKLILIFISHWLSILVINIKEASFRSCTSVRQAGALNIKTDSVHCTVRTKETDTHARRQEKEKENE